MRRDGMDSMDTSEKRRHERDSPAAPSPSLPPTTAARSAASWSDIEAMQYLPISSCLLLCCAFVYYSRAATVSFLESRFTFSSDADGFNILFDCPADHWCGMIVSGGEEPDVFVGGDTYALARHSVCDWNCCLGLKDNDWPDHSCPHPSCCDCHAAPIGLRSFPSVMGDGWTWKKDRGIGGADGLRGTACARNATSEASFLPVKPSGDRLRADLSLRFGPAIRPGFLDLDGTPRAVVFAQASHGAVSFDGNTTLDVGYHGRGAFSACLVDRDKLCGCGWPLTNNLRQACVPINSNQTVIDMPSTNMSSMIGHNFWHLFLIAMTILISFVNV